MLPRGPEIYYKSTSLTVTPIPAFTQTFQFKNNNFYQMNWDSLNVDVYYCTVSGTFPFTQFLCDADAIGSATYNDGGKFHTGIRGSVNLPLVYDFHPSVAQIAQITMLCAGDPGYVVFLTEGTVHAKLASGKDFGTEDIHQYATVFCN